MIKRFLYSLCWFGLLVLIGVHLWRVASQPTPPWWTYGERFPVLEGLDVNGEKHPWDVSAQASWHVVIYCRYQAPWQVLHYLQTLTDRYKSFGLRAIAIMGGPDGQRLLAHEIGALEYPLLYEPSNRPMAKALRLPANTNGTFFIDERGRIVFATQALLGREELRQLTEKFLLGTIDYTRETETVQPVIDLNFPVYDPIAENSQPLSVPADAVLIVVTAALCEVCNPGTYFEKIQRFHTRCQQDPNWRNRPIFVVVTTGFSLAKAQSELRLLGLELPIFQALAPMQGLEEPYFTGTAPEIVVALVDGLVLSAVVKPLDLLLEEGIDELL